MKQEDKRIHTLYIDYGNADYYKFYRANYDNTVYLPTYRRVIKFINTKIMNAITDNNYEFKIPKRLGIIAVRKHKKSILTKGNSPIGYNLAPDWKATKEMWEQFPELKELGKVIKFENKHSGGYTYVIKYYKRSANYKNKSLYKFKATRTMTRRLASNIKNNNLDAFIV